MLWKHGGKLCLAESWRKSNRISILKRLHALHLNALWPRQKVKTIEKLRKIVAVRYLEQSEYLTSDEFPKRWMLYIQKSGFLSGANWSQDLLFWPQQIQTVLPSKSMHRQRCTPHKYIYCDEEESKILFSTLSLSLSVSQFHIQGCQKFTKCSSNVDKRQSCRGQSWFINSSIVGWHQDTSWLITFPGK